MEEEKKGIADDIKEIFAEAKGTGFDVKAMRAIIRLRKLDKAEYQEQEYMVDLYKHALGMLDEAATPEEAEASEIPAEGDAF